MSESYSLGSHRFRSRLIIGSGKYASFEQNLACAEASGAEMVTVALRRTQFDAPKGQGLLDFISPKRFTIQRSVSKRNAVSTIVPGTPEPARARAARWCHRCSRTARPRRPSSSTAT